MAINNPFSVGAFGANNPELMLIKDPNVKQDMQRQALFRGLGAAGAALLANSGQSVAKAFGAGAEAFQGGADASMKQGLLASDEQNKRMLEQQRQEQLDKMQNDPNRLRGEKEAIRAARLFGDTSLLKGWYERPDLVTKVDINSATPDSVNEFQKKLDKTGERDYSLLKYSDQMKRSTADGLSAMQKFDAQIAQLLNYDFTITSTGDVQVTKLKENAELDEVDANRLFRMLSEEAWTRWYNNQSTEGSAVNDAARDYYTQIKDPDTGKFVKKWTLNKTAFGRNQGDPAGILGGAK